MKRPHYVTDKAFKTIYKICFRRRYSKWWPSTLSTIPKELVQSAKLLVKRRLYFGWCRISRNYFKTFWQRFKSRGFIKDGENAKVGDIAFIVTGSAFYPFHRKISAKLYAKEWAELLL